MVTFRYPKPQTPMPKKPTQVKTFDTKKPTPTEEEDKETYHEVIHRNGKRILIYRCKL